MGRVQGGHQPTPKTRVKSGTECEARVERGQMDGKMVEKRA